MNTDMRTMQSRYIRQTERYQDRCGSHIVGATVDKLAHNGDGTPGQGTLRCFVVNSTPDRIARMS